MGFHDLTRLLQDPSKSRSELVILLRQANFDGFDLVAVNGGSQELNPMRRAYGSKTGPLTATRRFKLASAGL